MEINPAEVAKTYREEIQSAISSSAARLKLVGLLSVSASDAQTYSKYMKKGCESVGIEYEERRIEPSLLQSEIAQANEDPAVTAIIVYYPIFGGKQDAHLREIVLPYKDVEGLHPFWLERLYADERHVSFGSKSMKALLPCTPLAVVKILEYLKQYDAAQEKPLSGKSAVVFNRSEIVGRPLAHMLYNDGADVYSFDINGVLEYRQGQGEVTSDISRSEALSKADIVVTGVPSEKFEKVQSTELSPEVTAINFSSIENFDASVANHVHQYVPRVGPVTVTMCLRNMLRIHELG